MSDIITRLLMNSSDYDKKMGRAKKSADDFGASLAKGIGSAAGKVAGALGLAMGAAEGFERVLDSTQKTGDLTRGTIHAIKTSVDEFFHSINRGNLSLFIDNLSTITNKAIEAYQALDQLGNTQISYGVFNAKNQAAIAEAQYLAKNKFAPTDERIKAFGQWKDALANEENNINALQGELINTVTKTVGSRVTANLKIEWEDIVRAFETDLMNVSKRDEIKSRAEMGTRNYEASWLSLSGVPPHQPGTVEQKNVAWTIVSGVTDELPDYLPALVTRNADTSQFATAGQFDSSTKGNDLITLGKKFASPFGDNGLIIVTKSGAVKNLKPRECNLRDVYGRNNLFLPDGIQLKYLEP
jgi:hypothetical protein